VNDTSLAHFRNRQAIPLAAVPRVSAGELAESIERSTAGGWRLMTLFGFPEGDDRLCLLAILADDARGRFGAVSAIVGQHYPSIAPRCPQAALFEREIAEQCGAVPEGHPSVRPLRRHAPDHAPQAWPRAVHARDARAWSHVGGDEVHEMAVGPVHAGIIEPGHFRFQAHGEEVLALEVVLGYQHRGIECLLEGADRTRAVHVAESIAGDSVIAHASAYCGALEALSRSRKSARAQSIRGIALELERLANHIGDLGALAGDVAYQPAAAFLGRMRGECLNLLMTLSGNRYGRGLIRPGGVEFDLPPEMAAECLRRVEHLREQVQVAADLLFGALSVQSRFEGVGVVSRDACRSHGFVGLVARSCEVERDVRHDHPYGVFRFAQIPVATAWAGDVSARALVRWLEVQRSLTFVVEQLSSLPRGVTRAPCGESQPGELAVALEEGWRGEILHALITDANGGIRRHKVQDPSFRNWPALALAMPGNQISDFPICNKSFNLSYAAHDL
jgi:Ni,Fe-hydrogenase III large subunit